MRSALASAPMPWVDEQRCEACGEEYSSFRCGVSWDDGVDAVRQANIRNGGGYRSRGPVLWAMRVIKLDAWYLRHFPCGEEWGQVERRDMEWDDADFPF
tara:strand:- start:560 stop:856 length:297 start_codon:yes stop_codon:yes gene_type:complete